MDGEFSAPKINYMLPYYKKIPLLKLLKCYNLSSMYLVHSIVGAY